MTIYSLDVLLSQFGTSLWFHARSHHRRSHPWQRSCGRDLTGKGGSGLKGLPESVWASTPKPKSVCLIILCLSPTLLILAHMIVHNSPTLKGTGRQNILKVLMSIESFKRWKIIRIDSTGKGLHYWANACCQLPISLIHCAPGSALVNIVGM